MYYYVENVLKTKKEIKDEKNRLIKMLDYHNSNCIREHKYDCDFNDNNGNYYEHLTKQEIEILDKRLKEGNYDY